MANEFIDLETWLQKLSDLVWGVPLLVMLVGSGIFLTVRIGFVQFKRLPYALKEVFSRKKENPSSGDISQFQSLMTALAATIGTGNIAGVATAVVAGGPGAMFWMWITAVFGMATKYSEGVLAIVYRKKNERGEMSGGPMYYIEYGLGWKWLAAMFAIFGTFASFGIGNMVQSNTVSLAVQSSFNVPVWITGIVLAIITGAVILGGIRSIGRVTGIMVPLMAVMYILGGMVIIIMHIEKLPAAFSLIFSDAFTGKAAAGGILGQVIRMGVSRGVFSNEAGMGSAPIASAAAKTDTPGRQGLVSMTGTFFDTIIVCSITGLILVMSGMYADGLEGAELTATAFNEMLPGPGGWIVTIGLIFFASSTLVGWNYYGEKCVDYLFGLRSVLYYRLIFTLLVFVGAVVKLNIVWLFSDIFNGLMAIPNLIALLALSGVIYRETRSFDQVILMEKRRSHRSRHNSPSM